MIVNRRCFPEIITDNDEIFLQQLCGIIESVDELSNVEITKTPYHYHFRIAPSIPKYINSTIKEIVKFVNLYDISLDFSKSIKTTSVITFKINQHVTV